MKFFMDEKNGYRRCGRTVTRMINETIQSQAFYYVDGLTVKFIIKEKKTAAKGIVYK